MASATQVRDAIDSAISRLVPARQTTGKVVFVDSGATGATATGGGGPKFGGLPSRVFNTINNAIDNGKLTANNGDIIFVMPGHNESITAATSLVLDVAGVSVIGIGQGQSRPTLDFDNTAGTIGLDAANCRFSNMVLRVSVSACTVGINVDANDIEIDNIETTFEDTGDDFLTTIDLNAFDRCHIHDCVFNTELGATAGNRCINLVDAEHCIIRDCRFVGNWDAAVIHNQTTLCKGLILKNLIIYNEDTSNYNGIDIGTLSTTGLALNCDIGTLYASAVAKVYRDGDLMSIGVRGVNAVSERAPDGYSELPDTSAT